MRDQHGKLSFDEIKQFYPEIKPSRFKSSWSNKFLPKLFLDGWKMCKKCSFLIQTKEIRCRRCNILLRTKCRNRDRSLEYEIPVIRIGTI